MSAEPVGRWLDAADAADLKRQRRVVVSVPGAVPIEILLLSVRGRVFAIENVCPHASSALTTAPVSWRSIKCQTHGLSFDLASGRQRRRPYQPVAGPLTRFGTKIENGRVYVELPRER
jgi:nitrite reductase/ring-hydroxylating ferredoxin subunit